MLTDVLAHLTDRIHICRGRRFRQHHYTGYSSIHRPLQRHQLRGENRCLRDPIHDDVGATNRGFAGPMGTRLQIGQENLVLPPLLQFRLVDYFFHHRNGCYGVTPFGRLAGEHHTIRYVRGQFYLRFYLCECMFCFFFIIDNLIAQHIPPSKTAFATSVHSALRSSFIKLNARDSEVSRSLHILPCGSWILLHWLEHLGGDNNGLSYDRIRLRTNSCKSLLDIVAIPAWLHLCTMSFCTLASVSMGISTAKSPGGLKQINKQPQNQKFFDSKPTSSDHDSITFFKYRVEIFQRLGALNLWDDQRHMEVSIRMLRFNSSNRDQINHEAVRTIKHVCIDKPLLSIEQ